MGRAIDVRHQGRERVICAFEVDGFVVDPGPTTSMETMLAGLGAPPRGLLLTHIHLDHAGATGVLVRRFPDLPVYVHERGAPHLVDPTKLLASARRVYGEEMDELWGEFAAVPKRNIRTLSGGERFEGFRVEYTPGHAVHHVTYLDEATGDAYVGDVAGVRIPPHPFTFAPTPPPDIDIPLWLESLERVRALAPAALCLTHFGRFDDVDGQLDAVAAYLERRREPVADQESFERQIVEEAVAAVGADDAATYFQAAPPEQIWWGLQRYWARQGK
ncbi:MAG TPA: MBL fold metallo-hydrolase [Thermoleophilaceae bacterium]|nr:MBL fold metallo-hydrolase [Thermoleophilaceae bacterium]